MSRILRATTLTALVAAATPALAQESGVRMGEVQVDAALRMETGLDSNVFLRDTGAGDEATQSLRIGFNPALSLSTPDPGSVDFALDLDAGWKQYLESDDGAVDQSGLEVTGQLGLRINPHGTISLRPTELLRQTTDPSYNVDGEPFRTFFNEAGLEIGLHPGGALRDSRLGLSGHLRGLHRMWSISEVDDSGKSGLAGEMELNYHFLPRTGLFLGAEIESIRYETPSTAGTDTNVDSSPYRVMGGLEGQISRALSTRLEAGYSALNYDSGPTTSGLVASARFNVVLSRNADFSVGYARDFSDSTYANYLTLNRVFATVSAGNELLNLSVTGYMQFNSFAASLIPLNDGAGTAETERSDQLVGADVDGAFALSRHFQVGGRYRLRGNTSDFSEIAQPAVAAEDYSYLQHEAFVFVQFAL